MIVALGLLCGCGGKVDSGFESTLFERVEVIGKRGTGVGEFNKPRSVAVDRDDNLYVVDLTGRVQKFSPDGNICWPGKCRKRTRENRRECAAIGMGISWWSSRIIRA